MTNYATNCFITLQMLKYWIKHDKRREKLRNFDYAFLRPFGGLVKWWFERIVQRENVYHWIQKLYIFFILFTSSWDFLNLLFQLLVYFPYFLCEERKKRYICLLKKTRFTFVSKNMQKKWGWGFTSGIAQISFPELPVHVFAANKQFLTVCAVESVDW
jgi:hypothetical protein